MAWLYSSREAAAADVEEAEAEPVAAPEPHPPDEMMDEYGGFDDRHINDALALPGDARPLPSTQLGRAAMLEVWRAYQAMPDRTHY